MIVYQITFANDHHLALGLLEITLKKRIFIQQILFPHQNIKISLCKDSDNGSFCSLLPFFSLAQRNHKIHDHPVCRLIKAGFCDQNEALKNLKQS